MNVTRPEMHKAVWYFGATDGTRMNKKMVVAIIDAIEKDKMLYTSWNCPSVTSNIVMVWETLNEARNKE